METFEIKIDSIIYKVTPRVDETFEIENDCAEINVIRPDLKITGVVWTLIVGNISQDFVNQVGELIEEFEM